ncbi:MAG: hypothetical protein GWN16_12680 [Calditrichae bacterium]|nr:hypothetical protein [Calditrichia bacterium]
MITILQIIFAVAMLLLGRKLFWVFVGSIGFITATEFAMVNFSTQPEWVMVLIGLAVGLVGALLAIFFQAGAIAFAGILGGGYLGLLATRYLSISSQTAQVAALVIGALIGLMTLILVFDYALIAISSLAGSLILVDLIDLTGWLFWILAVGIAILGISTQLRQFRQNELAA